MLLGNTDVKKPLAVILAEPFKPRAQRHCGSDKTDAFVLPCHFAHKLAEFAAECHAGILRLACVDIKPGYTVINRR